MQKQIVVDNADECIIIHLHGLTEKKGGKGSYPRPPCDYVSITLYLAYLRDKIEVIKGDDFGTVYREGHRDTP